MVTLHVLGSSLPAVVPKAWPALSIDGLICVAAGLILAYSLLRGHKALIREAISVYVGIVLASYFGGPVADYVAAHAGESSPINQTVVQLILLLAPLIVLQFGRNHGGSSHRHHIIVNAILAFLVAMLLISNVLAQLDEATLQAIVDQSNLAAWITEFKLVWLAAVPIASVASALLTPKHHRK